MVLKNYLRSKEKDLKSDENYPENFWPKLITLLCAGAFIYWVMTTPDSDTALNKYLFDPILKQIDKIK